MTTASLVMKRLFLGLSPLLATTIFLCVTLSSGVALAQQEDMTVEKLELYIQEQKALLEETINNREETKAKALEVQEALAEQDARREQLEKEVDELCLEMEAAEPGSYDDCKAQFSS